MRESPCETVPIRAFPFQKQTRNHMHRLVYSICRNIFGTTPRREERQNRQTRLSWHTYLIGVTASELAELLQRNVSIPHRLPGPLNHPKFRQFCLIRPRVRGLDDVCYLCTTVVLCWSLGD